MEKQTIRLGHGAGQESVCEVEADRIAAFRPAPRSIDNLAEQTRAVLENPLEFPALSRAVVAGDKVAIVLDRHTPGAPTVLAEVWRVLEASGVEPADVAIIQPVALDSRPLPDPRTELPEEIRNDVTWTVHDATIEADRMYLASTTAGERIYLARGVVTADFVLPIGPIAYDPLIGVRGTSSVFYPGLSTSEAIARARGQGHSELGPDDERPLRQLMDEIGWLMGVQFTVQVIPGADGGVSHVLAGACDAVLRRGREFLSTQWLVSLDERSDLVVVAVDGDRQTWEDIGAALATARRLVEAGGKIVLLTDLDAELEDGLRLVGNVEQPLDAIPPLRELAPPDLIPASELAATVDWAHVYCKSRIEDDLIEELFMTPIGGSQELQRLVDRTESCVFLGGAQHAYGQLGL